MKLDPKYKPEKACSRDASRPVLTCAYLDAEAGKLVATDSYQLAVVPVEVEEGDTSGLIPSAALAAWRKASTRYAPAEISANGSVEVKGLDGSSSFPRPDGQFPNYAQLVASSEVDAGNPLPVVAEFGVNVAVLAKCAAGLGSDVLRIRVYGPLKPLHVSASADPDAYGIVMPVRLP